MKSKSFDSEKSSLKQVKQNKTLDFLNFYKPGPEFEANISKNPSNNADNSVSVENTTRSDHERPSVKKKKNKNETLDLSTINCDGAKKSHKNSLNDSKVTSTPNMANKKDAVLNVKSIMKNSSILDDSIDLANVSKPVNKSKKRNKSVSFRLDDTEEVAVKKSKSSDPAKLDNKSPNISKNENKSKNKLKKKWQEEKENKLSNGKPEACEDSMSTNVLSKKTKEKLIEDSSTENAENEEKKKKKLKKQKKKEENSKVSEQNIDKTNEPVDNKVKKLKKKKRKDKPSESESIFEGEPVPKSRKKDIKPDVIADDLENLNIGDNAHTLTNLLDEMAVVDKDKKKNKSKHKKDKGQKTEDSENIPQDSEEVKEKVKWRKRKWNKDKKGGTTENVFKTILVENLPLNIMTCYKKLLAEHFAKFGVIQGIGIAEVYPTEDPRPVFTTTINFDNEDAATKALEEDNTKFEGNSIRVKRPLPPTQTTVVVRSYAELSDQALSTLFSSAGRIRSIRHLVKGKKSMATAFVEFHGPETVERAMKISEEVKIGGKKVHMSKFELRKRKDYNKNSDIQNNEAEDSS